MQKKTLKFLALPALLLILAGVSQADSRKTAVFETTAGTFEVELFNDIAPKAVENLLGLAAKGYYNGIIFHRVIDGFMIQGGDPTGTGMGGESLWGSDFEDEFSDKVRFDQEGYLAMANRGPRTNGSQFFITVAPTPHLSGRHTIFGKVTSGYDVVKKISQTPVDSSDKPLTEQKILRIYAK